MISKAQTLQDFAYATPERNRAIFSPGHRATYEWVHDLMTNLGDYFNVTYHEFVSEVRTSNITIESTSLVSEPLAFSPTGAVSGVIVSVPNFGCDEVCFFTQFFFHAVN